MAAFAAEVYGIYSLPTELLHSILTLLPTENLFLLTSVSRRFHAFVLHLIHQRLTLAASLDKHTLLLECYHPSARLTAPPMFCLSLGTEGLDIALEFGGDKVTGKLANLHSLYSRFRPQMQEPEQTPARRPRAGDIPGSRTYPAPLSNDTQPANPHNGLLVAETVSLEANELFSQLCCVTNLVTLGPRRGLLTSRVEVSDGMIRVWRNWLAQHVDADIKPFVRDPPVNDSSILWVNNLDNAVGIKFRVRERKARQEDPILYASDEEVAVSYYIDFEEIAIRTTYLLKKIEQSLEEQSRISTRAVIFGSFG